MTIGGRGYLLPWRSVAYSHNKLVESREDIYYRIYRKFAADATIAFPAVEQPRP